ncbi:hypothetical protein Rh054_06750 [Rickettsia conorii subsp. heilongjiangensis 054]|uniref:hypothetical protein n=1 Tax=spotted fever group TaxID=114277 RepID=UPI000219E4A9|nr:MULTISPECIES: hypothetical protein [spotted fever group]AEK75206.1 hypothetical protein Rh054_06750 [Rickettsia conorii subsp. heilongjiangensis 054]
MKAVLVRFATVLLIKFIPVSVQLSVLSEKIDSAILAVELVIVLLIGLAAISDKSFVMSSNKFSIVLVP